MGSYDVLKQMWRQYLAGKEFTEEDHEYYYHFKRCVNIDLVNGITHNRPELIGSKRYTRAWKKAGKNFLGELPSVEEMNEMRETEMARVRKSLENIRGTASGVESISLIEDIDELMEDEL